MSFWNALRLIAIALLAFFVLDKLFMRALKSHLFLKTGLGQYINNLLNNPKNNKKTNFIVSVCIFVFSFLIIYLLNDHNFVFYNNYSYFADALLKGRIDIPDMPSWLESIKVNGKIFMHFAPGPSIVLLPFIAIWGLDFNVNIISFALGAANAVVFYQILNRIGVKRINTKIWLTILFVFGTVHFFLAALAHSWFFGHVCTTFLVLSAISIILNKNWKRQWMNLFCSGFLFAFAVTCRLPVLLTLPFFVLIILFGRRLGLKGLITFGMGMVLPGVLYILLNYAKFGTFMDRGYNYTYMQEHNGDTTGPLQFKFIKYNLYSLLCMAPVTTADFPYIYPALSGVAVTFTTPLAYFAFRAKGKWYFLAGLWISIVLCAIPFLMNYGNGMAQFGMRYSMDFLPLVMILASIGFIKNKHDDLNWMKKAAILICVFINAWGIICWNYGIKLM